MAAERKERFESGEEVPDEEIPETVAETAHQLMQSGDYGDGPPYPLLVRPPPPWRGTQPETGEVIFTETKKLGKGRSTEFIRCFVGNKEVNCGGCKGPEAKAEEASIGGLGERAVPSIMLVAAARGPGGNGRSGRRNATQGRLRAFVTLHEFL